MSIDGISAVDALTKLMNQGPAIRDAMALRTLKLANDQAKGQTQAILQCLIPDLGQQVDIKA